MARFSVKNHTCWINFRYFTSVEWLIPFVFTWRIIFWLSVFDLSLQLNSHLHYVNVSWNIFVDPYIQVMWWYICFFNDQLSKKIDLLWSMLSLEIHKQDKGWMYVILQFIRSYHISEYFNDQLLTDNCSDFKFLF